MLWSKLRKLTIWITESKRNQPTNVATSYPPPPPAPSGAGECPRVPASNYCQSSSRPNCWSSGTYDLDCPNSGLCCFDGCHNRCLEEPVPDQSSTEATFNYSVEDADTYNNNLGASSTTEAAYYTHIDNGDESINQREPTLVLHIFGPPKSIVQFGNLPEKKKRNSSNAQRRISHSFLQ